MDIWIVLILEILRINMLWILMYMCLMWHRRIFSNEYTLTYILIESDLADTTSFLIWLYQRETGFQIWVVWMSHGALMWCNTLVQTPWSWGWGISFQDTLGRKRPNHISLTWHICSRPGPRDKIIPVYSVLMQSQCRKSTETHWENTSLILFISLTSFALIFISRIDSRKTRSMW